MVLNNEKREWFKLFLPLTLISFEQIFIVAGWLQKKQWNYLDHVIVHERQSFSFVVTMK